MGNQERFLDSKITRRQFLIRTAALGVSGVSFLSYLGNREYASQFDEQHGDLSFLHPIESPSTPMSEELAGICVNSPFLWKESPSYIHHVIESAQQLDATTIRIYVHDAFEPVLGVYNTDILNSIRLLAQQIDEVNNQTNDSLRIVVSLFDSYRMLHSDKRNADYGSIPLTSPYFVHAQGREKESKQLSFFTDSESMHFFQVRVRTIVESLQDIPQICAWELINEAEIPGSVPQEEAQSLLTQWYQDQVQFLRHIDHDRPIITGLARPWLIDEEPFKEQQVINSFHAYVTELDASYLRYLEEFSEHSILPLAGLEVGASRRLGGSILLPSFITRMLRLVVPKITIGSIGLWKIDNYEDDYSIDIQQRELTEYMCRLSFQLQRIYQQETEDGV